MTEEQKGKFLAMAGELSPENLTCDGESSKYAMNQRLRGIQRRWKALEKEVGRKVSENEAWEFYKWTKQRGGKMTKIGEIVESHIDRTITVRGKKVTVYAVIKYKSDYCQHTPDCYDIIWEACDVKINSVTAEEGDHIIMDTDFLLAVEDYLYNLGPEEL
jgi:hypothetical protein